MDLFFVVTIAIFVLVGFFMGLGRVLKSLTKHLPGKIAAVLFTYFIYGTVLNLPFVQKLLADFVNMIVGWDNIGGKILLIIRIDMIVFAAALFIAVRLAQKLTVSILASIIQSKNALFTVANRFGGALLSGACVFIIFLIFFQIAAWITDDTGTMYQLLEGSRIGLDQLFLHNPLNAITEIANLSLLGLRLGA